MKNNITKLEIQNFKSIKDIKIKCKRINLFIGKPNVGKSNILEALSMFGANYKKVASPFLSDYVRYNQTIELFYNKNSKNNITINIDYAQITIRAKFHNQYDFILGDDKLESQLAPKETAKNNIDIFNQYMSKNSNGQWNITPILQHLEANKSKDNSNILGDYDMQYNTSPIRRYYFTKSIDRNNTFDMFLLPPDGNNLAIILRNESELFERFDQLIQDEYGWELSIEEPSYQIKLFKKQKPSHITTDFNLIADTIQRIIFYHAAIASNKDCVLIFEEPEVHSFPPYVTMLAESIVRDKDNQYFISTHNPYLLTTILEKNSYDDVALFYVDYKNYQTTIQELTKKQISEVLDYGIDLFLNLEKFAKNAK